MFAGELVRPEDPQRTPDVAEIEPDSSFPLIKIDALIQMKLTTFRDKDRMHLRDLLGVGPVDSSTCDQLPSDLAERLRKILDDPDG